MLKGSWGAQGLSGTGARWVGIAGAHRWKMTARTVMAASRRKASAPRMEPITKDSFSGSWEDTSPKGSVAESQG